MKKWRCRNFFILLHDDSIRFHGFHGFQYLLLSNYELFKYLDENESLTITDFDIPLTIAYWIENTAVSLVWKEENHRKKWNHPLAKFKLQLENGPRIPLLRKKCSYTVSFPAVGFHVLMVVERSRIKCIKMYISPLTRRSSKCFIPTTVLRASRTPSCRRPVSFLRSAASSLSSSPLRLSLHTDRNAHNETGNVE